MDEPSRPREKAGNLAARQYGVLSRRQLTGLDYTEEMIEHDLETGRLQAWHRDVFAVGHPQLSPHGLCMAALLLRGEGAVISHQSAIWLWGLESKLEVPVHVTTRWPRPGQDAIGLHDDPALRDEDVTKTERLPVTAVPRALLDFAADAKRWRLERVIDRADRHGLLDLAAVGRITDDARGHRGRGALRRAMVVYGEKGFTRSGGERRMLAALGDAGVRRPAVNNSVEGHELDFFWGPERLAVELDSWDHYREPRSVDQDRRRRESLASAGIETIRITGTRLRREPRKVANRIAERLDRRREEVAG